MINDFKYQLQDEALVLLKQLIAIPSFSREEENTAALIFQFLKSHNVQGHRLLNNVWAANLHYDNSKPTILLNSHHDTVKPNKAYSLDPFTPLEKEDRLYGLGSNDAGASIVTLIAAFLFFYQRNDLKYNLILAATAEEEISGTNGIEALLPNLPAITCGIVGEPTQMQLAVAEKGLIVLDATAKGVAGHAARNEGENALYKAVADIQKLSDLEFERKSDLLGPVKTTVTVIETNNKAHNIIPAECRFVIDVRVNERYTLEEVFDKIKTCFQSEVKPRSMRIRSTLIPIDHPLVKAGISLGLSIYGSPTSSDKALMPFPVLKMGPGDSARSHTADEYVYIHEVKDGVSGYINLLNQLL